MAETPPPKMAKRLSGWGWFAVVVLLGLLVVAVVYAIHAWGVVDTAISPAGWIFMGMGIIFTLAVGGGLMALVFYSSRHDYDR